MYWTLRILACLLVLGTAANADVYSFDTTPEGVYQTLNLAGATVTFLGGNGNFQVTPANPGPPISGNSLLSFYTNPGADAFQVTFTGSVTSFSIAGGDHNSDEDFLHLRAYDASDNLIGSDEQTVPLPLYGGVYVSVLNTPVDIAYVRFWSDGLNPGSVYWDDMRTNANVVPEPASLLLFGTAAVALLVHKRRKTHA